MSVARLLCLMLFMLCAAHQPSAIMAQELQAELGKDSAWTGQPIPLNIKLLSPGPFSGTAAFDLPQLDRVIIQKIGRPIVGSEQIDGETRLTQLHEFQIYTQRTGTIEIPSFRVRYSAKQDFTSDAEPHQNETPVLKFSSQRPPGTDSLGLVVATKDLKATQDWSPASTTEFSAGDVITRSIEQVATNTTAMILPTIPTGTIDGIRIYPDRPRVNDQTERGEATATRTDTIKYQFERAGTYELPKVTVRWWNTEAEQLEEQVLLGKTVTVTGSVSAADQAKTASNLDQSTRDPSLVSVLLGTLLIAGLAFGGFLLWRSWQSNLQREPNQTYRQLIAACQQDDASSAYQLLQRWKRLSHFSDEQLADISAAEQELATTLYDPHAKTKSWTGTALQRAVSCVRHAKAIHVKDDQRLPQLNPSLADRR